MGFLVAGGADVGTLTGGVEETMVVIGDGVGDAVRIVSVAVTCNETVACGVVEPPTLLVVGGKVDVGISGFQVMVGTGMERLACKVDTLSAGSPMPCRS